MTWKELSEESVFVWTGFTVVPIVHITTRILDVWNNCETMLLPY